MRCKTTFRKACVAGFPVPLPPRRSPTSNEDALAPTMRPAAPTRLPRDRRAALCIGINAYRGLNRLGGCVADATAWAAALEGLDYRVDLMPQDEATGAGMLERIGNFVHGARPGDDLVLQFAGHGAYFDDVTGDEEDARDEALCGIDFNIEDPGFVLDDEIRAPLRGLARRGRGDELHRLLPLGHDEPDGHFRTQPWPAAPTRSARAPCRPDRPGRARSASQTGGLIRPGRPGSSGHSLRRLPRRSVGL